MDLETFFPFVVYPEYNGTRLDSWLSQRFPNVSRSRWARLIKDGHLRVNGKKVMASHQLREGDELSVEQNVSVARDAKVPVFEGRIDFVGTPPPVLYEDEDLLVINKPKGLTVHVGAGTAFSETLVAWLISTGRLPKGKTALMSFGDQALEEGRPGIVHRLDKPTSGALLICKTPELVHALGRQFATKEARRKYWAWISPKFDVNLEASHAKIRELHSEGAKILLKTAPEGWGDFVAPMGRDPGNRVRFAVLREGKNSHTRFRLIETVKNFSWLDIELLTGRTHQIRVHMSYLGYPLVGDQLYGGYGSSHLRLHAYQLSFIHPRTGLTLGVDAPLGEQDQSWVHEQGFSVL